MLTISVIFVSIFLLNGLQIFIPRGARRSKAKRSSVFQLVRRTVGDTNTAAATQLLQANLNPTSTCPSSGEGLCHCLYLKRRCNLLLFRSQMSDGLMYHDSVLQY